MALRRWGPTWILQLLFSLLSEAMYEAEADLVSRVSAYSRFCDYVERNEMAQVSQMKLILNG